MPKKSPNAIIVAALARAKGNSWPATAVLCGWPEARLQRWIARHRRVWTNKLRQARQDTRAATADEAVAVLRRQLRDKELKVQQQAASLLAKLLAGAEITSDVPGSTTRGNLHFTPEFKAHLDVVAQELSPALSEPESSSAG